VGRIARPTQKEKQRQCGKGSTNTKEITPTQAPT